MRNIVDIQSFQSEHQLVIGSEPSIVDEVIPKVLEQTEDKETTRDRLVVKKSLDSGDDIRLDEVAYTVILNEEDIRFIKYKRK